MYVKHKPLANLSLTLEHGSIDSNFNKILAFTLLSFASLPRRTIGVRPIKSTMESAINGLDNTLVDIVTIDE